MDFEWAKEIADSDGLVKVSVRCMSGRHDHCEQSGIEKPVYDAERDRVVLDSFSLYNEPMGFGQFYSLDEWNDDGGDCCVLVAEKWDEEDFIKIVDEMVKEAKSVGFNKDKLVKIINDKWGS